MQTVQLINVSPEQLQSEITKGVKAHLDDFLKNFKPKEPNDYLTRQDVAKMFNVDLSTVANWQKNGKLKPFGLGGRVYFLRSDVEASLTPING
jgi:FMN-dependent NADH-azoreductase